YLILTKNSDLSAGSFIAYIAIFSQVTRPAKAITDSFTNIHQGLASGERVLQLIDEKPQITDAPDAVSISELKNSITLNDVSFAYSDNVVLNGVSIEIPKGKSIALVGPSGGG